MYLFEKTQGCPKKLFQPHLKMEPLFPTHWGGQEPNFNKCQLAKSDGSEEPTAFLLCHISAPWQLRPLPSLPPLPPLHCCSVATACPDLCDTMDCSTTDFPVLHYLPDFAQTHAHWVGDAIQPSHPLLPPSPALNLRVNIRVFSSESALYIRLPKYWSFSFSISPSNEYLGFISFRLAGLISLQSNNEHQ